MSKKKKQNSTQNTTVNAIAKAIQRVTMTSTFIVLWLCDSQSDNTPTLSDECRLSRRAPTLRSVSASLLLVNYAKCRSRSLQSLMIAAWIQCARFVGPRVSPDNLHVTQFGRPRYVQMPFKCLKPTLGKPRYLMILKLFGGFLSVLDFKVMFLKIFV